MAQSGYDKTTPPGDAAPKTTGQRARQGQNVRGMLWVLGLGIAFVVIAYVVMIALSAPTAGDNQTAAEIATPVDNAGTVSPSEVQPTAPPQ